MRNENAPATLVLAFDKAPVSHRTHRSTSCWLPVFHATAVNKDWHYTDCREFSRAQKVMLPKKCTERHYLSKAIMELTTPATFAAERWISNNYCMFSRYNNDYDNKYIRAPNFIAIIPAALKVQLPLQWGCDRTHTPLRWAQQVKWFALRGVSISCFKSNIVVLTLNCYLAILLLISLLIKILEYDDPFSRHCLQLAIKRARPFLFIDFISIRMCIQKQVWYLCLFHFEFKHQDQIGIISCYIIPKLWMCDLVIKGLKIALI